jgi:murein hydrolase activator
MKRIVALLVISILFSIFLTGQSKEDLQAEKQKAYNEIKLARELMEKTAKERSSSVRQLIILQKGIKSRAKLISTMEEEVELLNERIVEAIEKIEDLSKENNKNREEYERLIYFAYRNHTEHEKMMYILAGSSISESYQRYKYLKYISEYRVRKAGEIENSIMELDKQKEQLNLLKNEKLRVLEDKELERVNLEGQRSRKNSMVSSLQKKESKLKRDIREKERIAKELEDKIREIIEEEARNAGSSDVYAALTPEQELIGNDFRKNKGKLPWPVEKGIVTGDYGLNEIDGLRGSGVKNNGIDISSSPGTEVRAVFEGEVKKVFAILGANYAVLIRHGEYLSVYQNLVNVRVKTGDKVLTKEKLGEAFTDNSENVAFMHFELWLDRNNLNPEEWISK